MTTFRPSIASAEREVFRQPGFVAVYAVGVAWSLCRWAIGFLGAYVVADATDSARLVQLTGALLWSPLLFAGAFGGAVADRFQRKTLLFVQFGVLGPLTAGIGLWSRSGDLPLGILYGYMLIAGMGWVVDMTARRTLVYDLVGDDHIDTAMAFEGLASAFGLVVGTIAGGALIGVAGVGVAYLAVAGAIALAAILLTAVPTVQKEPGATATTSSMRTEMLEGLRLIRQWPTLASVLGVTALVNLFHFSYFPIVPVIAQQVNASPFATGLLAAATGLGMAVGASFVLASKSIRRGALYIAGALGGLTFLVGFGAFDRYWLVFASLFAASAFIGLFSSTQAALTMTAVDATMRGRAMGLLSMAIGVLPFGMMALGELSELVGARAAIIYSNLAGIGMVLLFLRARPQSFRIS